MKKHYDLPTCRPGRGVWVALIYSALLFAAAWCLWGLCTPLLGDDLKAAFKFRDLDTPPLVSELRYSYGIYLTTNARTGDMLAPLWLYALPPVVGALMLGAGVWVSIIGITRLSGVSRRTPLALALFVVCVYVALPWRDMLFRVCHFNYVWGTALCALILIGLLEKRLNNKAWIWCVPLVFVATATHEASGFPLGIGLIAWWVTNRKQGDRHLTTIQKWWIAAILAGALFSICSPASYARLGSGEPPQISLWGQLTQTIPLVVLLAIRMVWLWVRTRRMRVLLHTRWTLFAAAAFTSAVFTLAGGIGGRGGWYAEVFALIALGFDLGHDCRWLRRNTKLTRRVAMTLALGCNLAVMWWGVRLMEFSGEARQLVNMYKVMPEVEMPTEAIPAEEMPYIRTTLPLSRGERMKTGDEVYTPKPLQDGERNPADPAVSL